MLTNFIRRGWPLGFTLAFACGKGANTGMTTGPTSTGTMQTSSGTSGSSTTGGPTGSGSTTSGSTTSGSTTTGGGGAGPMGDPGCGLQAAAFCDNFNAPAAAKGRAGDLDVHYWAAGRLAPQLPTARGLAIGIGPAVMPNCRSGIPAMAFPDQDTAICDPSADIG